MSTEAPWISKPDRGVTINHPRSTWLTYETYYGLGGKPFSLSSDPAFFYNSSSHASAFCDLLSGIRRRESLSVLSGDIGTGKTTLCRTVLQNLDLETFSAFVPDPFTSREDLLKIVLADFGVVSADDLARGRLKGASRTELSYLLYEFLGTLAPLQAFAVVVVDEAQNLSLPLLEEIRILSDSDGRQRQLQVVLVGQLELREKLQLPEMRQVAQRVSVRCTLEPLDRDGVDGYIAHRLHVAGGSPDRVRFSREAIDLAYEVSGGVPRLINRLCDRALHHGHVRRAAVIDRAIFEMASAECGSSLPAGHTTVPAPQTTEASTAQAVRPSEAWLAAIDESVNAAMEADSLFSSEGDPAAVLEPVPGERVRIVPLTRMEALSRRWVRRFKMAVLLVVVIGGAGLGLSLAVTILSQTVGLPSARLAPAHAVSLAEPATAAVAAVAVPASTSADVQHADDDASHGVTTSSVVSDDERGSR